MAERGDNHSRELKKVHGNADVTREITILNEGSGEFVVQVQDVFCRNDDPRSQCTETGQCFRTSRRSPAMSLEDAIVFADGEFARSVDSEHFRPHERLLQSPFVLALG